MALGVQTHNLHSIDINGIEYRTNKFIVGFDTEKLFGLSFAGTNAKNTMMTVMLKTLDNAFLRAAQNPYHFDVRANP